jgi:hypothetical protein
MYFIKRINNKAAALTFITLFLLIVEIVKYPLYLLLLFFSIATVGIVKFPFYVSLLLFGIVVAVFIAFVTMSLYVMFQSLLEYVEK